MKPKRWVNLSAIKRLLLMPGCIFSEEAAAAVQQHCHVSLASAPHPWAAELRLLVARNIWFLLSPTLSSLLVPPLLREPCQPHPGGQEGRSP